MLGDAFGRSALFIGIWSRMMNRSGWLHPKVGFPLCFTFNSVLLLGVQNFNHASGSHGRSFPLTPLLLFPRRSVQDLPKIWAKIAEYFLKLLPMDQCLFWCCFGDTVSMSNCDCLQHFRRRASNELSHDLFIA